MIGTEFIKGQGLGNQLFLYISARCIAAERGVPFCTAGQEQLAVNIHSKKGMYFMDMDLGIRVEDPSKLNRYDEKEERLYLPTSQHDITNGVYVAGADPDIKNVPDDTILYGNLQAEEYFASHREEICEWLKVKPEYETYEWSRDDLCIINVRGGEYADSPELFLDRSYWMHGIKQMKKINPAMQFVIVTDDPEAAAKVLPGLPIYHGDLDRDYVMLKNAKYLLLSNSTFAFFPAFTSETLKLAIAPKYWARHNVSTGYWASEQNIYSNFTYMDRKGKLFTPEECRQELAENRSKSPVWEAARPMTETEKLGAQRYIKQLRKDFMIKKAYRSLLRRLGIHPHY